MKKRPLLLKLAIATVVPPVFALIILTLLTGDCPAEVALMSALALGLSAGLTYLFTFALVLRKISLLADFYSRDTGTEGDLTRRVRIGGHDELAAIARNHNVFLSRIHRIVFKLKNIIRHSDRASKNLAENSKGIARSLNEILSTTESMSEREHRLNESILASRAYIREIKAAIDRIVAQIDSQSASVNQSSAAVEQTIASIRNIDSISKAKASLALRLKELASAGGDDMQKTLEAMELLSSSVSAVTELITVINDVAEKTNLLAMNAAIEAAHAGEHGKGFSVVADEIHALAEATAENATEISQNLLSMFTEIDSSRNLTVKTSRTIGELIDGINQVADSLSEITDGLTEMSGGTSEITASLTDLIGITTDVKANSRTIDKKTADIDAMMSQVIDLSAETLEAMKTFTQTVSGIKGSTDAMSRSGAENADNIAVIDQEVSRFTIIDTSQLVSGDGQSLIQWNKRQKVIPPVPEHAESFPETDARHWYGLEYAGWHCKKNIRAHSPADGAEGKRVVLLESCDHPYHTAYKKGCMKIAEAFGVTLISYNADYSPRTQAQQVEQALRDKPDLIIVTPTSVSESSAWFKKINEKGIPVIGSNTTPDDAGFRHIIGWTGPDDWGQFRLLAQEFARQMGNTGCYGIIRHAKGNSNYYSRTWSIITELKRIAPEMECIAMESAIKEEETRVLTRKWLAEYGPRLKGIAFSDPGNGANGLCAALHEAGRQDIIVVSSGNSETTQNLVRTGAIKAITFQSAEADGALAMEMAVDWFNGLGIEPIRYLPMKIITSENVGEFYPAQW